MKTTTLTKRIIVGFIGWLVATLGALQTYLFSLEGQWDNFSWMHVLMGAMTSVLAGLNSLVALVSNPEGGKDRDRRELLETGEAMVRATGAEVGVSTANREIVQPVSGKPASSAQDAIVIAREIAAAEERGRLSAEKVPSTSVVRMQEPVAHLSPYDKLQALKPPPKLFGPPAHDRYAWGTRSLNRLSLLHPDGRRLMDWVLARSPYDISIGETAREVEQQIENVKNGVSWTLDGRHLEIPYAMAVDFYIIDPITNKLEPIPEHNSPRYIAMYTEVLELAMVGSEVLDIPILCGGLAWDKDYFHIQLDYDRYPRGKSKMDGVDIDLLT